MADILAEIDATVDGRCACGCGVLLAVDGPSGWFASSECQVRFAARNATRPADVWCRVDAAQVYPERDARPVPLQEPRVLTGEQLERVAQLRRLLDDREALVVDASDEMVRGIITTLPDPPVTESPSDLYEMIRAAWQRHVVSPAEVRGIHGVGLAVDVAAGWHDLVFAEPVSDLAAVQAAVRERWSQIARGMRSAMESLVAPLRAIADNLPSIMDSPAPLIRSQEVRQRRARISRAWSDPSARWSMWDRKADRTSKVWRTR